MLQNINTPDGNGNGNGSGSLDLQLAVEGILDPRSAEFKSAIKLTPATLGHYRTKGRWLPAEHLLLISSILASEISQGDARIIVEVPPRHGKSELISVHTPIWFLEKFPWASVILSTYAADLSEGFGRRVRDAFLEEDGGFLNTMVRDDIQRTSLFLTPDGGGMASVGIGGPITGRGAHLLLIDDYIKNYIEASSVVSLDAIWNWFITTAYTRLEPGGSCVILATRWVIDDLIGRLKAQDSNKMWTVIRMPAIAEADDILNRRIGEALWPGRYPIEKLREIQSTIGNYMFSAMYQQDPKLPSETKADVEMLKEVDVVPGSPENWRWIRSWDLAATSNKGDWTVGTLIGTDGRPGSSTATTCLGDTVRGRWATGKVETTLQEVAGHDGAHTSIIIEQEPGAAGKAFAQHLATNVLRGYKVVIKPNSGRNKWVRAQPYIAAVSHGRVIQLRNKWNKTHKEELKVFPDGKHDDTVDSASQGFNHLHLQKILQPTWGRDERFSADGRIIKSSSPVLVTGCVFGRSPGDYGSNEYRDGYER